MDGEGERWLKKHNNKKLRDAVSHKWELPLMVWKQRGIFQGRSVSDRWSQPPLPNPQSASSLWGIHNCFTLRTHWLNQQMLHFSLRSRRRASVHAQCSNTITALCGSDDNNRQVGGIWIRVRWDLSHCWASKTFCSLYHFWIQVPT